MNNQRDFPSAFQNMNRNRNNYQRPAPAPPSAPPKPNSPNPLEINETNFPSLGTAQVPNQVRVFDTSFAKRVEQTKQIEEVKRIKEERLREEREKANHSKVYMVQRSNASSNRYYDEEDEDYDDYEYNEDYVYRQEENQPLEEDEGWTTVTNTKAFKPKQTLTVEQLAVKYIQTEVDNDEQDLHTTEDRQDMFEYGYRHTHG